MFEAVGKRPRGKTCEAINGLLAECQEAIEEGEPGPVLDAALIASIQGIKTYGITRYGSLLAFARQMGLDDAMKDLETLRDAARNDDQALSKIAESSSNVEASQEKGEDDEKGSRRKTRSRASLTPRASRRRSRSRPPRVTRSEQSSGVRVLTAAHPDRFQAPATQGSAAALSRRSRVSCSAAFGFEVGRGQDHPAR